MTIKVDNVAVSVAGDKDLILQSADLINEQISEVSTKKQNITAQERLTFAALNIAENKIVSDNQHSDLIENIVNEINNITNYLINHIDNPDLE